MRSPSRTRWEGTRCESREVLRGRDEVVVGSADVVVMVVQKSKGRSGDVMGTSSLSSLLPFYYLSSFMWYIRGADLYISFPS